MKLQLEKLIQITLKKTIFRPSISYSEKLENLKLNARGLNSMPDWKDALEEYSKEFIKDINT